MKHDQGAHIKTTSWLKHIWGRAKKGSKCVIILAVLTHRQAPLSSLPPVTHQLHRERETVPSLLLSPSLYWLLWIPAGATQISDVLEAGVLLGCCSEPRSSQTTESHRWNGAGFREKRSRRSINHLPSILQTRRRFLSRQACQSVTPESLRRNTGGRGCNGKRVKMQLKDYFTKWSTVGHFNIWWCTNALFQSHFLCCGCSFTDW